MILMENSPILQNSFNNIVYLTDCKRDVFDIIGDKPFSGTFDETVKEFVYSFSNSLMSQPEVKSFPDLVALAFWMRKSNIIRLENDFKDDDFFRVPVGSVIHFAPSNVDTIFIYSLFLSLLVGNVNLVRLSEKPSPQKTILVNLINQELNKTQFKSLKQKLSIITYPHSDDVTSTLCANVNMRVIWGGDTSVNKISSYPLRPGATELKFVDKYSMCFADPSILDTLAADKYKDLVKRFVNDTYWFGQQGCSSPRTVVWLNADRYAGQIDAFWCAVAEQATALFGHDVVGADIMNKLVVADLAAVSANIAKVRRHGKILTRVKLSDIDQHNDIRQLHCGSGLFFELSIKNSSELAAIIDRKVQTISYFGLGSDELKDNFKCNSIFPDRVVPVGEALNFSVIWDGINLLKSLTRIVDFK